MQFFLYLRLMVLTAGTLLPFFWIVVILGHRRQRNFERIFFFLCLSLIFFFGASLLQLNAQLFYPAIPPGLTTFAWTLVCLGLWFLPALLLHLHVEYAEIRELLRAGPKWLWLLAAYGPVVVFSPKLIAALRLSEGYSFLLPTNAFGVPFQVWMIVALAACAGWQGQFLKASPDSEQKSFHRTNCFNLSFVALWMVLLHFVLTRWGSVTEQSAEVYTSIVGLFALVPLIGLIRSVQRFNFLQIGRQRNLIFTVFAVFVALLYLSLIRRFTQWLEPYFPPEATAAILLFLPVVLFEPLQRFVGGILRRTAHAELDRAQSLFAEIQQEARRGDLQKLIRFIESRAGETLELSSVKVILREPLEITEAMREFARKHGIAGNLTQGPPRCELVVWSSGQEQQAYRSIGNVIAVLHVRAHGAALSGETQAALEFLCEQLPGALDLCRLIEEKLKLERELAERERLAVLGQMAASISHNLKNPLGSMKTILQVQLENPELPETIRGETKMVLEEIGRLSTKLNQLLQFSRPAVIGEGPAARCNASEIAQEVVRVLGPDAQKRGVALEMKCAVTELKVAASAGAVSDILTNLVVNAMDATVRGGRVEVRVAQKDGNGVLTVEDDGPGVPAELREKILQPFFTTKAQGTGLGLAIVARRAADVGGRLEFESPARNNRGAKFSVWLPTEVGAR